MGRIGFNCLSKSAKFFICSFILVMGLTANLIGQNGNEVQLKKGLALLEEIEANIMDQKRAANNELLIEALKIFEATEHWDKYFICLSYQASNYFYQKDYENYFLTVPEFVQMAKSLYGTSSINYAKALSHLSLKSNLKGNFYKSIEWQKKGLQLKKKIGTDEWSILRGLENLGISHQYIGDHGEALSFFKEALKYTNNNDNRQTHVIARLYRQMGNCYLKTGQYKDALHYYNKSRMILDKLPEVTFYQQTEWYAYRDLSELYLNKSLQDSALYFINKALEIQNKISPFEAYKSYIQLGDIQLKRNDLIGALTAYENAYVLAKSEFSNIEKHPSFALSKAKMASVFQKQANFSKSLEFYQEALCLISDGFGSNDIATNPETEQMIIKQDGLEILVGKADALFAFYKKEANPKHLTLANECYLLAVNIIKAIRKEFLAEGSKHNLASKALPIYEKAIEAALLMFQKTNDHHYLEQAFAIAENNKAVLLFESIRADIAKGFAGIPDSLIEKEYDLNAELNFYEKQIKEEQQKNAEADQNKIKLWENKLFGFRQEYQELTTLLEKKYPNYYDLKYQDQTGGITEIRKNIPDHKTALVEYMIGQEKSYVFFLTKNDLKVYEIKETENLAERVSQLRRLTFTPPDSEKFGEEYIELTTLSHALYSQLLEEGLANLPEKINRLMIVPDDLLCYLPFEILLQKKPKQNKPDYSAKSLSYLMEDYYIGYQYSASLMAAEKAGEKPQADLGNFIGFAPAFEGSYASQRTCSTDILYSLQCNEQEVTTISEMMAGKTFVAAHAGLDYFFEHAPNFRILHLATHACVDDSDFALSKIYLSDGDLSQYDLNNLKLNAELTVLSACNTAMGRLLKGEGMMSLTRSFMLAGSNSVLTSLWSVDDCATSDIMIEYYKYLKKGRSKDEALAKAKLNYLEKADRNNRHPYYWGAFVQFGDSSAIDSASRSYWYLLAGFLIVWVAWNRRTAAK